MISECACCAICRTSVLRYASGIQSRGSIRSSAAISPSKRSCDSGRPGTCCRSGPLPHARRRVGVPGLGRPVPALRSTGLHRPSTDHPDPLNRPNVRFYGPAGRRRCQQSGVTGGERETEPPQPTRQHRPARPRHARPRPATPPESQAHSTRVSTRAPSSVIAMVCSECEPREPSWKRSVQPSGSVKISFDVGRPPGLQRQRQPRAQHQAAAGAAGVGHVRVLVHGVAEAVAAELHVDRVAVARWRRPGWRR